MKKKYKRGTIGHAVQALANKRGKSTQGIYILARALELALSTDDESFHITGIYDTKAHKELVAKEHEFLLDLTRREGARDYAAGKIDCPHTEPEFRNAWCEGFNNANPANINRVTA